ncbi:MAG: DUF3782 domain-containing protein [Thermocladium sp.]
MEIRREILKLIKDDEEFRKELMDALGINNISIALKDIGDSIKELAARLGSLTELQELLSKSIISLAEAQKKTEENITKLTERVDQLAEAQRKTEERLDQLAQRINELAEAQRRTEERLNKLTERVDQLAEAQRKTEERLDQLAEAQKRTEDNIAKLTDAVIDLRKGMDQLRRSIDSIGKRWGADYEELIRGFFKEVLDQLGIDIKYLNKFTYKDNEGIFGFKGVLYEIDIMAKNDKVYLIEVKSFADSDDVEWFRVKVDVVSKILNLKDPIKMILAVSTTKEAIDDAQAAGIKLIYGDIFEVKRRSNDENEKQKTEQNNKTL